MKRFADKVAIVTGADSYRGIHTFISVHLKRLNTAFGLASTAAAASIGNAQLLDQACAAQGPKGSSLSAITPIETLGSIQNIVPACPKWP